MLHRACQDESNDAKIVEIQAHMWKIWFIKNHRWMKKIKIKENWRDQTLDEKSYIQIMDENLQLGWKQIYI